MKKIDEEIRQTTSSLPVRLKARMNLNFHMYRIDSRLMHHFLQRLSTSFLRVYREIENFQFQSQVRLKMASNH